MKTFFTWKISQYSRLSPFLLVWPSKLNLVYIKIRMALTLVIFFNFMVIANTIKFCQIANLYIVLTTKLIFIKSYTAGILTNKRRYTQASTCVRNFTVFFSYVKS